MYIEREPILYLLLFLISIKCAEIKQYYVDRGKNLTIRCPYYQSDVMWVREGREDRQSTRSSVLKNGSLFLKTVDKDDSGLYSCSRENVVTDEKALVNVTVRTPPPALANVKVVPSTILAVIVWEINGTGGYPIMNFTAQYRLADTDNKWIPIPPNHITPSSRQIDVYGLQPNTSYEFKVWATNQLGRGEITQIVSTTKGYYSEEELARQLLAGADEFDTRAWAVAVGIVMGTLILLGLGTCFLLYQECRMPSGVDTNLGILSCSTFRLRFWSHFQEPLTLRRGLNLSPGIINDSILFYLKMAPKSEPKRRTRQNTRRGPIRNTQS